MKGWPEVLRLLVSNSVTLLVALFVLYGDLDANKDDTIEVAFDRVTTLEGQTDELRETIADLSVQNLRLQGELLASTTFMGSITAFLESLPNPAWVKEVVIRPGHDVQFRMAVINRAYEDGLGKNRQFYLGKTDFEVWPRETAEGFYRHDLDVWQRKAPQRYRETFNQRGEMVTRWVIKYLVSLQSNGRWGIAGVIFDYGSPFQNCPEPDRVGALDFGMHVARAWRRLKDTV